MTAIAVAYDASNEELDGLRNECNKRRRYFQRARKENRPNAIEEQEAYIEARRMLRIAIGCKMQNGKLEKPHRDDQQRSLELPNMIVMDKIRSRKDQACQKTKKVHGKVLFPTGEPTTSSPTQRIRRAL